MEFALIVPLLLLFILGVIEAGRMLVIYSSLSSAAKQAARYGAVAGDSPNADPDDGNPLAYYEDCSGIKTAALRASILVGLDEDDIGVGYDRGTIVEPVGRCALGDPKPTMSPVTETIKDGYRVIITLTAVYRPLVPIVPLPDIPITFAAARTIFTDIVGPTNTPRPNPDLRITKVGLPLVVSPNGWLTYWITATNPLTGVVLANQVVITDTLPVSVSLTATDLTNIAEAHNWNCSFVVASPPQQVSCARTAPLAPGQSAGFSFPVRVPLFGGVSLINRTGVQSNKADLNNADNYTYTTNYVLPGADLQAFKTVTSTMVSNGLPLVGAGTPLTYTLWGVNNGGDVSRVRSTGPTSSQTFIWITDTLPTGSQYKSINIPTGWECPTLTSTQVGCKYKNDLGIGASTPLLTLVITAPVTAGTITNTAVITPSALTLDPIAENNAASVAAAVTTDADLELFMAAPSGPYDLGRTFTIRINVTNRGPSIANSILVTNSLPAGLAYDNTSGWDGCTLSGAVLVCSYNPTLFPGQTSTDLILTVHGVAEGFQTNRTDAGAAQPDPDALVLPSDVHREATTEITSCQPTAAYGPNSTISGGNPGQVQADGVAESTIIVELRDRCNALVTGSQVVTLSSDRGGADVITPASVSTTSGQATFLVKSSTSGTASFTATANGVEPVPGSASVTFYACVRVHAMAVGGSQQFLPFSIDNTTGLARRLIALEIIWPAGGNKRFTGVSLSGTTLWTGSANGSPITISGGDWIGGTDGARTVPNNPGSPLPMLQLSFNFPVVTSPPSQQFSVNTTWDDGNGGSLCSTNISVTR